MEILALDSGSGTYTSTFHLLNIDTTGYKSALMAQLGNANGIYQLVLSVKSGATQYLNHYQITNTTLALQQQLHQGITYYSGLCLTQNAEF